MIPDKNSHKKVKHYYTEPFVPAVKATFTTASAAEKVVESRRGSLQGKLQPKGYKKGMFLHNGK